jgi:hypothetical protein
MATKKLGLSWDGLDELRALLKGMPIVLGPEVKARANAHASAAATTLRAAYPEGLTGNLRRGVRIDQVAARGGSATVLVSAAPHAWIFERGTVARFTKPGWRRGKMPASNTFASVVGPARRRLIDDLVALLVSRGFEVKDVA